jgi:hypothetical protein
LAEWIEEESMYKLTLRRDGEDGGEFEEVKMVKILISAVGGLRIPRYPNIKGIEKFKGESFHSARWDWNVKLEGKKVGVLGNGSSALVFLFLPFSFFFLSFLSGIDDDDDKTEPNSSPKYPKTLPFK